MARRTKATAAPAVAVEKDKKPRWVERAEKKLASSGLTMEDGKNLGIEVLTAAR